MVKKLKFSGAILFCAAISFLCSEAHAQVSYAVPQSVVPSWGTVVITHCKLQRQTAHVDVVVQVLVSKTPETAICGFRRVGIAAKRHPKNTTSRLLRTVKVKLSTKNSTPS